MDNWDMTHLCSRYGEGDCEYFLQTDNKETILNGKRLDICCYYCTSENKVRKIGSGGSWTGLSPKFCPKRRAYNNNEMSDISDEKTEVNRVATFDISTMLAAPQAVMPEQYTQAAQLHAEIINCAKTAQENLYQMAMRFKKMRDEKLYIALGYDNFGDYCEKKAELSRQNVYQYIKVVENLPKDFVLSTRQIGKEKMYLLSTISEAEREEIVETTDLEKTTVQKLKEKIKALESRNAETIKASVEEKQQLAERDEEINRLRGENIKLRNRDEKSTSQLAAEAAKAEELKAEKERLEQLLQEAQNRKSEKPEIVGDPADKEMIANLEAQIKGFESRPVDVIYEKDEVEINRLKDRISELEKELEAEADKKTAQSDIKVFTVRLTLDSFEKLIDVIEECGDPVLKEAVMKAQILIV